jgi:hypothetical protein
MRHPIQLGLTGLPHGILGVFNTIFYENEFQNPQIVQSTLLLANKLRRFPLTIDRRGVNTGSYWVNGGG